MGQQPNIQPGDEDRPRRVPGPSAARRWAPARPGELGAPDAVPWGGAFGTPTPDGGFAARLVAARDPAPAPGEDRRDLAAALRVIASARASRFGRGPALIDVEVAETLLGVHPDVPADAALLEDRVRRLRGLRHDATGLRRLVATIDPQLLESNLEEVRDRVVRGEGPFGT